jgi:SNF2 family DNA or RNA helicase
MSTPSPLPDDPWDWSVEQVVRQFCGTDQDRPAWCSPTDHLPTPGVLERELWENDVTGEVLLTAITKQVLRDDLHIKSMGQRHAIDKGISFLRSRSQKFQNSPANVPMAPPFTPLQSWLQNSGPPYEHPSNIGGSIQSGVPPSKPFGSPRLDTQLDTFGSLHPNGVNARASAQILAPRLSTPRVEATGRVPIDSGRPALVGGPPAASPQPNAAAKVRRRIAPIFVAHLDDKDRHALPLFGEENDAPSPDHPVEEETVERGFTIFGAHVADGQQLYASRRMKKYLTLPEPNSPADRHFSPELHAADSKENTHSTKPPKRRHDVDNLDSLNYLLAKYPPKSDSEDVLALYGESGDEGNYDEDTWHEMERDLAEDKSNRQSQRALPASEVNTAVEEAIEEFKSAWQDTRLAKVQAKGYRLWKKAQREGRLQSEIATAQFWIQHLEKSVVKICQAITGETWSNVGAVRHQCQSLEQSIFQQQEHRYNISVLRKPTAPPRPDRQSVRRANPKPVDLAEGDILLESESDLSTSNFIDYDDTESFAVMPIASEAIASGSIASGSIASDPIATGPIFAARLPITTEEFGSLYVSEDSDEVISPLAKRRKARAQPPMVDPRKNPFFQSRSPSSEKSSPSGDSDVDQPATLPGSKYEKFGHEQGMPIDLISSSEPPSPAKIDASENTPAHLVFGQDPPPSTPTRLKFRGPKFSPLDDLEEIKQMEWEIIEINQDYRRALAKAVFSLDVSKAIQVRDFIRAYAERNVQEVLQQTFNVILHRQIHVNGISEEEWSTAKLTALLFASYCLARRFVKERHLVTERIKKAQELAHSGMPEFLEILTGIFSDYPPGPVSKKGKRKLSDAGSKEVGVRTSDSDSAIVQQTPGKKRRREVKQSQMAISSQIAGQQRVQEMEQRMASKKFQNIPGNMKDPASYVIGMEEPVIYLDPKIGGKVKPHQIDGIRFMWRELMTDKNKHGCLLAHTMGLGKTMQVISLLVTIAQSVKSAEAGIRNHIPHDLHELKALILCPPSLIDNWYEEILMWRPDADVLGELYKITQRLRLPADRVQEIARWSLTGGILIISYDMFRGLIVNKASAGRNAAERPLSDKDHAAVQEHLLNHPNIIIADEAHKMKNTDASISMVTSRFKSTRRIALTGSPLANNLDEYFAMIDWIAPGYLGTREQFRSKYAIPISEGLWNESDMNDRRLSLRRLHVLKKNLDPKISRADITAIAGELPSKTEFFITVPLTKMQIKAYNLYVASLLGSDEPKAAGNARLWDWLAILSLLCNHPSTFLTKLDDRQYGHGTKTKKARKKTLTTTDDVEGAGLPTDIEVADAGLSPELVEQQREIFRAVEDSGRLEDPILSHRCEIVCEIIRLAVAAGDKVLLFSHSIPTLNYLEGTISSLGYTACRLDGSTNVTKRQDAVNDFNKATAPYNVFFISTRAGGLGLNLQGANRVILFDYGFNPIWEEQAVGRAYRLGQQKAVFVYRLRSGGTFEELIYNKAVFKTQLSARVVDQKNPMRHASKKATDYLFPVKDVAQKDLTQFQGKDPDVLDQVLRKSNCIRDITLTETFQKEEDESLTPDEEKQANDELKDEQEKRKDPVAYERKLAQLQATLLNARQPTSISVPGRPSPYNQQFALRTSFSGYHQTQPYTIASTPTGPQMSHVSQQQVSMPHHSTGQQTGYISRPAAIDGPQQAENLFWDHRASPHLQNRVQNVIGARPFHNTFPTVYPSPTAERQPSEAKKTSESPKPSPQLGKQQRDGVVDGDDEHPEKDECKTQ